MESLLHLFMLMLHLTQCVSLKEEHLYLLMSPGVVNTIAQARKVARPLQLYEAHGLRDCEFLAGGRFSVEHAAMQTEHLARALWVDRACGWRATHCDWNENRGFSRYECRFDGNSEIGGLVEPTGSEKLKWRTKVA